MIREWVINSFNVAFSHRGMEDVLYRLNLRYTRPTYVLKNVDPTEQEKFKNNVFFSKVDEIHLSISSFLDTINKGS